MSDSLLRRGLKLQHLRLIDALAREGQVSRAAERLGITQPAASRLGVELERLLRGPAYHRSGRGIVLTAAGEALAGRAARVLQELGDAGRELAEIDRGETGHVRIGSVTGPAIEHILPVIRMARLSSPGIAVSVEVATSDVLGPRLLAGEVDFSLARLPRDEDPALFHARRIGPEPVSLVVRHGHPLLRRAPFAPEALLEHDWVLPFEDAILRRTVAKALGDWDLPMPPRVVSTSSFLFTLVTVQQTNAIAPLASAVGEAFAAGGTGEMLTVLPSPLQIEVEPYAMLTRAGQRLTPAAQRLHDLTLRQCGIEV